MKMVFSRIIIKRMIAKSKKNKNNCPHLVAHTYTMEATGESN